MICPTSGFYPRPAGSIRPRCSWPRAPVFEMCFLVLSHKICPAETRSGTISYLESRVQPVHQPYLTMCQGYRLCSTYRTTYKVTYHQSFKKLSRPVYTCCPGWRRPNVHASSCSTAVCRPPCQNGGRCSAPNRCTCPLGWTGKFCQTDVDECAAGKSHGCSQMCVNAAGSYHCACQEGHRLRADGKSCQALEPPTPAPATRTSDEMKEEAKNLKNRVELLEQKLQLMLAPFHNLVDDVNTDPISLLSYSFQQLDRIDSLSEQISFLEERLETCK
uniref:EGF like domain multiple 7 n=1 Tax=Sphenodon punctatus TaxID=8508 RepID=A0A8D0HRL3_SPHPU